MSSAQQGHDFRGWYLHEDNGFASSPNDSSPKAFGADATIDQAEGSNQAVQVFGPDSRVPVDVIERVFSGSWSVTFTYTNPWWLNFIFGAPSTTDNADGSYTHTWDGEKPQSQQIGIGRTTSGKERVLKGCVATQASVQSSVNGMAQVSISGAYAKEEVVDNLTEQPTIDQKPMTFADASLALGGTTLGYVQQGSLQIQNNIELINEWGTRTAIDFAPRTLTPSVNFSKINEDGETDNLQQMYGEAAATSIQEDISSTQAMTLGLDNGNAAGSGVNSADFNLQGTFPESYGESGLGDPQADVTEDINRIVEGLTVEATNETATAV